MTQQEFAQSIKAKYPTYKNIDDATLVTKIVEKYPVYKSQISDLPQEEGYFKRVGQDIKQGFEQAAQDITAQDGRSALSKGLSAVSNVASAVASPITEAPVIKQVGELAGKGIDLAGKGLADLYSPEFQSKLANMSEQEFTKFTQPLQDVANAGNIANNILLAKGGQKGGKLAAQTAIKGGEKVLQGAEQVAGKVGQAAEAVKNVTGEIVPSLDRLANESVTKAMQLTEGDVRNIESSTGNIVGRFMADNNLIGNNLKQTQAAVKEFFDANHKAVRSEIAKVKDTYTATDVPRFKQTLTELKGQVQGIAGQEAKLAEIDGLLKKDVVKLEDVQRTKELIDDLTNLYKKSGDVKDQNAAQGFAQMRSEIKSFIEKEVKDKTGSDIGELNNKVATSKGILDAAESRATSGITKSNIQLGDLGAFGAGTAVGGPLVGVAAVFAKKALQSPAVMFRIAKYLDRVSDARKAKLAKTLQAGKVPTELEKIVQSPSGKQTNVNASSNNAKIPVKTAISKVSNKKPK